MGKEDTQARITLDWIKKFVLIVEKNHPADLINVNLLLLPPRTTKSNLPHLLMRTFRIHCFIFYIFLDKFLCYIMF